MWRYARVQKLPDGSLLVDALIRSMTLRTCWQWNWETSSLLHAGRLDSRPAGTFSGKRGKDGMAGFPPHLRGGDETAILKVKITESPSRDRRYAAIIPTTDSAR